MLEIKNLSKTYKPKKGVPVTALNSVSLAFPEKGMVFLLGKSGCGKSTLLNLLGGLDSYDSGEIIISGQSSRTFRQGDFDSYRNTLVGFIFQEYNVLEEFTVGANIALALELQGKKATDEEVGRILAQVDLAGYGARRPNELSGGQKQRVAIARALVKNPKIIMADEPTGALDSATGRQVLETLKNLSREKLVIVVSHDREFAEQYADRIIELFDGTVISDREFTRDEVAFEAKGLIYGEGEILVSQGYRLTEEDRNAINAYLSALDQGAAIRPQKITARVARDTVKPDHSHLSPVHFIKSRLPMKAAFRIGCGALKYKKIRLFFTIFLSCIAFGLFGLADTFSAYDHITTCTNSIIDSAIEYASAVRAEKYYHGEDKEEYYYRQGSKMNPEDLEEIREQTGITMEGVFIPYGESLSFDSLYNVDAEFTKSNFHIYPYAFNGFAELDEKALREQNMELLAGRLPKGDQKEIAVSSYICETFYIGGFAREEENGKIIYDPIKKPEDLLGKVFPLNGCDYTVVGIVSSGFDLERYRGLTEEVKDESTANMLVSYALFQELSGIRNYSLCQLAFVGKGHLDTLIENDPPFRTPEDGYLDLMQVKKENGEEYHYGYGGDVLGTVENHGKYPIVWVDGKDREHLKENEVVLSLPLIEQAFSELTGMYPDAFGERGFSYDRLTDSEKQSFLQSVGELGPFMINTHNWATGDYKTREINDTRIVGILLQGEESTLPYVGSVLLANKELVENVVRVDDGVYKYAVGPMPEERSEVENLVRFSNREEEVRYELQNPVTFELEGIHEVLVVLADVFLYIGIAMAVFASLMLANFIGTSIAYKKQEIGILRAIGARSGDVFRIFFSEGFVIAMINFALSAVGTFVAVSLINYALRSETGILITMLTFSFRQVALLFVISLAVAAVSCFLPVKKIASKKPIDAIRGR